MNQLTYQIKTQLPPELKEKAASCYSYFVDNQEAGKNAISLVIRCYDKDRQRIFFGEKGEQLLYLPYDPQAQRCIGLKHIYYP